MTTADLYLTPEEEKSIRADGRRHVLKNAPCGQAWDTFQFMGKRFEIIDISERTLGTVANAYYLMESCGSPEDFIRHWKSGHFGDWDPARKTYVHWFREINANRYE